MFFYAFIRPKSIAKCPISAAEMETDPVTVFAPVPRFRIAPDTILDRSKDLILRRFRGGRVALMSLGKVVGRSLRNRRKMRRDSAPFLGFRRDPRRDRSDLAATPVSPWVGVRGPGRGGGCEKIKGIKLDSIQGQ